MTVPGPVTLALVDDDLLRDLTRVAVDDAAADEVTPPLTEGGTWTPERVAWFEDYHRRCRLGLAGPAAQAAWAIVADGRPVGSVRLQATGDPTTLETGIWLARSARGHGLSAPAMAAVLDEARSAGATTVRADTALTNTAAQALMRRSGFALHDPEHGRVHGAIHLCDAPGG